ncbi:MAG: glutamate--tRNA ligase [Clostridia bacterium]|nr:glutamate--tRNA ligase [Clostridia bacterium]
MDYKYLSELLFPNVTLTREEIEARYPARNLPEGAKVTRFAPSPTGFIHLGGLFPSTVGERLAHQSGGVFYLRIEDTDSKREVDGAAEALITTLEKYNICFDEGASLGEGGEIVDRGAYGPYKQSARVEIYHVYAKWLVERGLAYPVFNTKEELEALRETDKKTEVKSREWTPELEAEQKAEMLRQREFTIEEVEEHLRNGDTFVLRMLANGDPDRKIKFTDLIKGNLEIPENDKDEVLLKSDGIPTYHFAHAVDDHLMGTTHIIRDEEWLPSLPRHIMLFKYLEFKLPKYMHIAQIMHLDENGNKKKLSKRDMGSNVEDYRRLGYTYECVSEYIMTLLNSNFEEWRAQNLDKKVSDFPFSIKKMSTSGCLLDFNKLTDVSKNVLSRMSADEIYAKVTDWAREFDPEFAALLEADPDYARRIFAIGRGGKKPRKDFATLADVKPFMGFFYDEYFTVQDEYPEKFDKADIKTVLTKFLETFDPADDMNTWFGKIQEIGSALGYTPDMKAYKADPDAFKGNVGDVSMFIRIAITGKMNSPDMYAVMQILGKEKVAERINKIITTL